VLRNSTYTDYRFLGYSTRASSSSEENSNSSSSSSSSGSSVFGSNDQAWGFARSWDNRSEQGREATRRNPTIWRAGRSSGSVSESGRDANAFGESAFDSSSSDSSSSSAHANSSYSQDPVVKSVQIPYSYYETVTKSVVGVRIFGWGAYNPKTSPWHTLLSSDNMLDGLVSASFETKIRALVACHALMINNLKSQDSRFVGSRCFAAENAAEAGSSPTWRYEVRTQNPFL